MSEIQIVTEPLGGGALARAAAAADRAVAAWYEPRPTSPGEWADRARRIGDQFGRSDWRGALGGAFGPGMAAAAARRLERVVRERGVVVTTGQQPGLFGGAILCWTKALSALVLADAIEAETGIAAAPVFWSATDDADFEEASVTTVAVPGGVDVLRMPRAPDSGPGTPMADEPLADVQPLLDRLSAGAGSASFAPALALLREAYLAPGATVGGACVRLLRGLLEPLGIPVLDVSHRDARSAMYPVTRRALECANEISDALVRRDAELRAAGFEPQVENDPSLAVVFRIQRAVKERVSVAMAARVARDSTPGELTGNVLLRPVVERSILPTVAYVAGPAEIAYFAQTGAVAEALELPRPLAVPRWSGTIIEPHVSRILRRIDAAPSDLAAPDRVEQSLVRAIAAHEGAWRSDDLRRAIDQAATPLFKAAEELPPGAMPRSVIEGALSAIEHRLRRLDRRYLAALKRREAELMRDVATARGALYPGGVRQERVLNFIALLARHGEPLLAGLRARTSEHAAALVAGGGARSVAAIRESSPHAAAPHP